MNIHATAIIGNDVTLGNNVEIGPYCVIDGKVTIGDDTKLISNVRIEGETVIGKNNTFYHSAVIGTAPQDLKYKGEPTRLRIGDNNNIREFVTINRSATMDEDVVVGNNCLLMAYTHIAHNCQIGNEVIIANAVNLAGHIHIGNCVIVGGMTAIHQFVKIGNYAFVGGASGVKKDVPPFTIGEGMPYKIAGINRVGLNRRGFTNDQIDKIKTIYKLYYASGLNFNSSHESAKQMDLSDEQKLFVQFAEESTRGLCKGRSD